MTATSATTDAPYGFIVDAAETLNLAQVGPRWSDAYAAAEKVNRAWQRDEATDEENATAEELLITAEEAQDALAEKYFALFVEVAAEFVPNARVYGSEVEATDDRGRVHTAADFDAIDFEDLAEWHQLIDSAIEVVETADGWAVRRS